MLESKVINQWNKSLSLFNVNKCLRNINECNFWVYLVVALILFQVIGCALGDPIARSIHNLIWNLSEVSREATQKMCELVESGSLPCYLLTKSIFENKFR